VTSEELKREYLKKGELKDQPEDLKQRGWRGSLATKGWTICISSAEVWVEPCRWRWSSFNRRDRAAVFLVEEGAAVKLYIISMRSTRRVFDLHHLDPVWQVEDTLVKHQSVTRRRQTGFLCDLDLQQTVDDQDLLMRGMEENWTFF